MPILAGQTVTETIFNRLRPKKYYAVGSGTLTGPLTNSDVTGATITVTTETAGAEYAVWCVWDLNNNGAPGGSANGRMALDGVPQTPLATFHDADAVGRGTSPQNYGGTLATAGSHTFKLVASPNSGQQVQGVNCSIMVEIAEVI